MNARNRISHGNWLGRFSPVPIPYRIAGLLPLALFAARWVELVGHGKTPNLLWVCHLSNLLIALGLFFATSEVVRASTLWLIVGAFVWPIDIARTGIMEITSIGTHYVGLALGMLLVRQQGMGRFTWLYGLGGFVVLQHITRLVAPPEMNINLAHSVYPGWDRVFPVYWQYWLFTTASAGVGLWLLDRVLGMLFGRAMAADRETGNGRVTKHE